LDRGILFLLGAGASRDAGLPLASELTQHIVGDINNTIQNASLRRVINYVVATMIGHRGKSGLNPKTMPDIESVVSAVELLSNRTTIELVPFIQNWDPAIDLLDQGSVWNPGWVEDVRQGVLNESGLMGGKLEQGLKGFMEQHYKMGIDGNQYSTLMDELLRQLKKQLALSDSSPIQYLEPLIDLGKTGRITIASINYDLTIETVAKNQGVKICRGIDSWNEKWKMEWCDSGIQLIKLHGSIDWGKGERKNPDFKTNLLMPEDTIVIMDDPSSTPSLPFVVYGKREKLRPQGPFSELRTEFISELRKTSHLIIVGYSFGDDHINELITKWLNSDPNRKLVILDPNVPDRSRWNRNTFLNQIFSSLQRVERGNPAKVNVSRVLPIQSSAKLALADLCMGIDRIDNMFEEYLAKVHN